MRHIRSPLRRAVLSALHLVMGFREKQIRIQRRRSHTPVIRFQAGTKFIAVADTVMIEVTVGVVDPGIQAEAGFPVIGHAVVVIVCSRRHVMDFIGIGTFYAALVGSDHDVVFGLAVEMVEGAGNPGILPVGLAEIVGLAAFFGEQPVTVGGRTMGSQRNVTLAATAAVVVSKIQRKTSLALIRAIR